jgi:TonB family protein
VNGTLPRPSYGVQADGKVVVKIWVDQYGNVTKAQAGVEGTTATDKTLWQAAYKAALGAHFNMDASAPPTQVGTITYIFRMR